jgi:hypothetical protein
MNPDSADEFRRFDMGGKKLRNGLYLRGIVAYPDRIVFEVFASRPFSPKELADLALSDDQGTIYTRIVNGDDLEGEGEIAFEPTLPEGALFRLGEPGWGLSSYRLPDTDRD